VGIILEFIPSLLAALAFDFFLYATGSIVLRAVSFGFYKSKIYSYREFKALKSNKGFLKQYLVGIVFYIVIIITIVWFN